MTGYINRLGQTWSLFIHQVKDLFALSAKEVDMRVKVTIVTDSVVINGYHLGNVHVRKHAQRIINRCTTQRWYCFHYTLVHFLNGWMSMIF